MKIAAATAIAEEEQQEPSLDYSTRVRRHRLQRLRRQKVRSLARARMRKRR